MEFDDLNRPIRAQRPAPIQFPDPATLARERERRAHEARSRESAAFLVEQERKQRMADQVRNAFAHGHMKGYIEGVNSGLWRGGIAGLLVGSVIVGSLIKLGYLVGA